jgi:hypothetical protein
MSVLKLNGGFEQANTVGSMTIDVGASPVCSLGALDHSAPTNFMDGDIADYWLTYGTGGDIGIAATVAIDRSLHAKIAFEGPFAHPPIAYGLRHYWSFRAGPHQKTPPDVRFIRRAVLPAAVPELWTQSTTPPVVGPDVPRMMRDERSRRALLGKVTAVVAANPVFEHRVPQYA